MKLTEHTLEFDPQTGGTRSRFVERDVACACNVADCKECVERVAKAITASEKANPVQAPPDARGTLEKKLDAIASLLLDVHDNQSRFDERLRELELGKTPPEHLDSGH